MDYVTFIMAKEGFMVLKQELQNSIGLCASTNGLMVVVFDTSVTWVNQQSVGGNSPGVGHLSPLKVGHCFTFSGQRALD